MNRKLMQHRRDNQLCSKCGIPGDVQRSAGYWLCQVHFRIQCMRDSAKCKGKTIPTFEQLESMAADVTARGRHCGCCGVLMAWRGSKGQRNVVSLQHDRSGAFRFICLDCNFQHRNFPGDTFYDYPIGWKYCPKCDTVKPPDCFYVRGNGLLKSYCRDCKHVIAKREYAALRARA